MRDKHKTDKHMSVKHTTDKHTPDKHTADRQTTDKHTSDKYTPDKYTRDTHTRQTSKMLAALPCPNTNKALHHLTARVGRDPLHSLGAAWPPANTNALAEYKLNCSLNVSGKCVKDEVI